MQVINDEIFAILVLMALATTFMTTPAVIAIYKSSRIILSSDKTNNDTISIQTHHHNHILKTTTNHDHDNQLRILACIHGQENIPSLVNLIHFLRTKSPLKLYVMHLVQLTDSSSSIMMVQRSRKNGFPFVKRFRRGGAASQTLHDQVAAAFEAYTSRGVCGELVTTVRHATSVSALSTMHEDILHVAEAKRVSTILLPFHRRYYWRRSSSESNNDGEDIDHDQAMDLGHDWRGVNNRVMKNARCSVAVFVDRGFDHAFVAAHELASNYNGRIRKVCVVFEGGADDREALELGWRMAQVHEQDFRVTVVRLRTQKQNPTQNESMDHQHKYCCSISAINGEVEKELDEAAMEQVKTRCMNDGLGVEWIEKEVVDSNLAEAVVISIGHGLLYELVIVGKGRFPYSTSMVSKFQMEQPELGPIGDTLASSQLTGIQSSVLVVQVQHQYSTTNNPTAPLPKMVGSAKDAMILIKNEESVA